MTRWLPDGSTAIHAALTAILAWLGLILALPFNTFNTAAAFRLMAQMAHEEQWAMGFWFAASVGFVGLFTPFRLLRLIAVGVVASAHSGLAALCLVSAPTSVGSGVYGILASLGYYLLWLRMENRS